VTSSFSKTARLFTGARLRITRHDAVEASYSYSPNQLSFEEGTQPVGSGYTRVDLISFNYVRYLWIRTRVQPFATAGLGTNRFSGGPFAVPASAVGVGTDNGWQFAWNYGGGADIALQRHFALRLELRDYVTGQPSLIAGTSHNVVPSVGIVFRLK
jgi:opacity protein-like surface antigen